MADKSYIEWNVVNILSIAFIGVTIWLLVGAILAGANDFSKRGEKAGA